MIDDALAYRNLFATNLKTLPIGVLRAISAAVGEELEARKHQRSVAVKAQLSAIQHAEKTFQGHCEPTKKYHGKWLGYLQILLDQDWSNLFSGDQTPKYYVYIHSLCEGKNVRFIHPQCSIRTNGLPFYVGKGTGDRAYDLKRNQGHGATLRQLLENGREPGDIVSIVKDGLTEPQALELESKLIYFFGTKYEKDRRGILVNLDIPARPRFGERLNLKKINQRQEKRSDDVLPMPW